LKRIKLKNIFRISHLFGTVEYMNIDTIMLKEMKRILRSGGIGIITLRNIRCVHVKWNTIYLKKYRNIFRNTAKRIMGKQRSVYQPISRQHDPRDFKNQLKRLSFTILEEKYCHYHTLPLPFSIWFSLLQAIFGKAMEKYLPISLSPMLASTYIVKFVNAGEKDV
tara:strand:- start:240 stop:734 length:495 start_codon:yes stop_codon:yes gene_type:complete